MLARLWWKEYRVFGPVWLILGLAAALLQWLFLSVNGQDARTGGLTNAALCWAVLYAFATGAASFSGEREAKTLGFLDALPVGRGMLWLGKASFAMVSTFVLALLLTGMAALGTEERSPYASYSYYRISVLFVPLLFEAVAWSLLWSSLSKNPLLAGVMGVLSEFGSVFGITVFAENNDPMNLESLAVRFLVALGALATSGLVMAWRPSVLSIASRPRVEAESAPIAIRKSSTGRSLLWQARREGWTTWLLAALLGFLAPVGIWIRTEAFEGGLDVVLGVLACLTAGVSVFGAENASGSRRFLVHHGVRPGTVWLRKFLLWGVVLVAIFGVSGYASWSFRINLPPQFGAVPSDRSAILSLSLVNAFAVGILCGMTITRRITAALVGVIAMIALVPLQLLLVEASMVPGWSVYVVPLILVIVSRVWAGDWLMEREGFRPWLKLGGWLAVPFGVLGMAYISYRAYSVPDVGPQYVLSNLEPVASRPNEDAAAWYRGVKPEIRDVPGTGSTLASQFDKVIEQGWDSATPAVVACWKAEQSAIELARRTSALPIGRFEDVNRLKFTSKIDPSIANARTLATLLALDTRERLSRGDLPGAWDDLLAQLRVANQLATNTPTVTQMTTALTIHHRAVGLTFDWLGAPGLSTELVKKALANLKALPNLPNLSGVMQVEALIIDRTLDLSGPELSDLLLNEIGGTRTAFNYLIFARVVAAPWERQRARRACRLWISGELASLGGDPYQRRPSPIIWPVTPRKSFFMSSQLAHSMVPNVASVLGKLDREVVGRRALEQAMAIEAWKFGHDGTYPDTLNALVPGLLDRLPLDPYSGKPFVYVRSQGQPVIPPIYYDIETALIQRPTRPGQPLLYSVGPNRVDNGAQNEPGNWQVYASDHVYAIP